MINISRFYITCVLLLLLTNCKKSSTGAVKVSPPENYSYLSADGVQVPGSTTRLTLATAHGRTIILAGGIIANTSTPTDSVYIYDTVAGVWSARALSAGHWRGGAIAAGTKMLLAGGLDVSDYWTDAVDIYDSVSGQWTTAHLSIARSNFGTTSLGTLVAFAGGANASSDLRTVDFYDAATGTWTTDQLNTPRYDLA